MKNILFIIISLCLFCTWLPVNASETQEYLILINAENPLPEDYFQAHQEDFVDVTDTRKDGRPVQKMLREAAEELEKLITAAKEAGFSDISVTSAYRSRKYQKQLFDDAVESYLTRGMTKKEALHLAGRYFAAPGCSEHESGLAVDMHHLSCATLAFAETAEYRWLAEHAHLYGYILRYPEGKEKITGIAFEPWHFRYVGKEAATEIYHSGICLEEYLRKIS